MNDTQGSTVVDRVLAIVEQAMADCFQYGKDDYNGCKNEAVRDVRKELRALLAATPEQAVDVGEPYAWAYSHTGFVESPVNKPVITTERWPELYGVYSETPLYRHAQPPAKVEMLFDFEHPITKEKRSVALTKRDAFDGMEDYFYDKLGEQICQCESVGETNVVDCNCDEYVHDFEIVDACLDEVARLNTPQD